MTSDPQPGGVDDHEMALGVQTRHVQLDDAFDAAGRQLSELLVRVDAFHGQQPAVARDQVSRTADKVGEFGKGAGDHHTETGSWTKRFDTSHGDLSIVQCQLVHRLLQEGASLMAAVEQHHGSIGTDNRNRKPGQARPGTHIHYIARRKMRDDRETIEQMMRNPPFRLPHSGQVVDRIPLAQQHQIVVQLLELVLVKREAEPSGARAQRLDFSRGVHFLSVRC